MCTYAYTHVYYLQFSLLTQAMVYKCTGNTELELVLLAEIELDSRKS